MRGLSERHITISITDSTKGLHGLLWIRGNDKTNGKPTKQAFRLSAHWQVKYGMNYCTIKRVIRQLTRMGLDVSHIELYGEERKYCYCTTTCKDIFSEKNHVPLVSELGVIPNQPRKPRLRSRS